jgi:hypothetical protein
MTEVEEKVITKWKDLIEATKNYYVDSIPTGLSDSEWDSLEQRAMAEDGFSVRDYVFNKYLYGKKTLNKYIEKVVKTKVVGCTMLEAMENMERSLGKKLYWDLKYDGSSIAVYLNPATGKVKNIVTVGNLNLDNYGIDQTWKLKDFIPTMPNGIVAIQCEALIDVNRLSESPDRARQKANGLINSKYCMDEVKSLLTLIGYRYYFDDPNNPNAQIDYRDMIRGGFRGVVSQLDGHLMFGPAQVFTLDELRGMPGYTETDVTVTESGTFLNDGWVAYDERGVCQGALKFAGAGSGDKSIITEVKSIQWNDQSQKGKDSWSANVLIDPVSVKGIEIKKPSAGSVSKLVSKNITPGAKVGIILANSTIPMVGEVFQPGNGDFMWPTCSCGYKMSENDVYGSLLKCGNPMCTERIGRMKSYLGSLGDIHRDLNLNNLLVIDRFKWEDTNVSIDMVLGFVESNNKIDYYNYLMSYMNTDLRKKNLNLVWEASFMVLRELFENVGG